MVHNNIESKLCVILSLVFIIAEVPTVAYHTLLSAPSPFLRWCPSPFLKWCLSPFLRWCSSCVVFSVYAPPARTTHACTSLCTSICMCLCVCLCLCWRSEVCTCLCINECASDELRAVSVTHVVRAPCICGCACVSCMCFAMVVTNWLSKYMSTYMATWACVRCLRECACGCVQGWVSPLSEVLILTSSIVLPMNIMCRFTEESIFLEITLVDCQLGWLHTCFLRQRFTYDFWKTI